jgi:hypothetical protein
MRETAVGCTEIAAAALVVRRDARFGQSGHSGPAQETWSDAWPGRIAAGSSLADRQKTINPQTINPRR